MAIKQEIIQTINYFSLFSYAPSLEEIHCFLRRKIQKKALKKEIDFLVKEGNLIYNHLTSKNSGYYTLGEYSIFSENREKRRKISYAKIAKITNCLRLLSFFSSIKLVGLSGTVAMMNAKKSDDIDLFVITTQNRLWTGRFIALIVAQLFGLRRKRKEKQAKDKVCLNLLFDESALEVLEFKKNEYVAHEVLQMKPLINKDDMYQRFLEANAWVFKIFPNAKGIQRGFNNKVEPRVKNERVHTKRFNVLGDWVELTLKKFQRWLIYKHRTNEIVTDTQLWFFPEDFEKQVLRKK